MQKNAHTLTHLPLLWPYLHPPPSIEVKNAGVNMVIVPAVPVRVIKNGTWHMIIVRNKAFLLKEFFFSIKHL